LVLLTGGIGSGKTTFVQALAESLGVGERVTSPSFVLHALYESGYLPLSHVDLYRLEGNEEIEKIGFDEFFDDCVTVVEWADRYDSFEQPYLSIAFDLGPRQDDRVVTLEGNGGNWLERLRDAFPIEPQ
jgi:tRNA threonylcarbamoyladenosine biosynthesis protein TsaE